MSDIVEKITSYVLGGFVGAAVGFILLSFDVSYIDRENAPITLIFMTLIGVLVSIAIFEYRKERSIKRNNKIRDETVALITHEMRTGLTSTGWALQLVLQNYGDTISAEHKKMLEDVISSIHTTVMHSVNLLDISLLDIGKLSISLEWVFLETVEAICRETIEKYTFGAERKGIALGAHVSLDPGRQVEIDTLRLRIILENLLENALQYTSGTKKEITVVISNDSTTLHMMVKDTGIGIPLTEQEKIFSEFYRASNARKKLSSGSGIGLYLCEQYVKAHRGTIRFESKENEGTTFFLTFPLKTAANVNEFLTKI